MTAEDARRSVEALSQLLRDEVDALVAGTDAGTGGAKSGSAEPQAWLVSGEQQLTRALRISQSERPRALGKLWNPGPGARVRGWALAALVVCGVGLGAGLAVWHEEERAAGAALSFRAGSFRAGSFQADEQGGAARRSGRVMAPADGPEEVLFSDGSRLSLSPGSMLRVRETDAHGAMVIVEEGQVESTIQHTGKARWSVFAGPYEVRVVGTRFATSWDPAAQRLAVVLHQGSVQVLGKGIDEVVELKPGQRFDSAGTDGKWFVTATAPTAADDGSSNAAGAPDPSAASGTTPSDEVGAEAEVATAADSGRSAAERGALTAAERDPAVSWSTLVAHGRFEQVLDEASVRGEATCLRSCSVADLRALADAARYTGRFGLAERALSQLRSTAPAEAPRAGFLLGSMHEAQGRASEALEWYGRYLAEAPSGGLAAEARAGRMRALLALGQTDAAKAAARDYLRLHPAGVGAATARQILLRP